MFAKHRALNLGLSELGFIGIIGILGEKFILILHKSCCKNNSECSNKSC